MQKGLHGGGWSAGLQPGIEPAAHATVVYLFRWKLALGLCLVKLLRHLRQHSLDTGI